MYTENTNMTYESNQRKHYNAQTETTEGSVRIVT